MGNGKICASISTHKEEVSKCGKNKWLDKCAVLRQDEKYVSRKKQFCILFSSPELPGEDLYVVRMYCKVTQEGPRDFLFTIPSQDEESGSGYDE
eukprot:10691085-Ditylum_brightwellii.AAC.1